MYANQAYATCGKSGYYIVVANNIIFTNEIRINELEDELKTLI